MTSVIAGRMTADRVAPFAVFLIGMRINKPLRIAKWWPVLSAMPRMVKELEANPQLGFLGSHSWLGRTTIMLQYWESFDKLEQYAKSKDQEHLPAWREFNRRVGASGDVGIWHETYAVRPGTYECIYSNMPPFGLGKVGPLVAINSLRDAARQRIERQAS
jgi:fumigallin biosynthesis monooxygenase-like protein